MVMSSGLRAALLSACLLSFCRAEAADVSVTTYHNDNGRTGWNAKETVLTESTVKSASFKRIKNVALDEQVDAQPLVAAHVKIGSGSAHDIVYVATENNTVYAINAETGNVLLSRHLGNPVPESDLPGGCNNNAPNVGIDSTPVIDLKTQRLYVVADTLSSNGNAVYKLHALSLATLADAVTPVTVSASAKLSNGGKYHFSATVSRLRAGLLLSGGNIYAGFASYCDSSADQSRGWVLGWNAGTLAPLASNDLTDVLASSPDNYFLTSIWMSGYGLAADSKGNVFFVTGNSDFSGTTFNAVENIAESAASVSSDLSRINGVFTPSDWSQLDQEDGDFGSGGLMLLPKQAGSTVHLAAAAGKDGNLYFMNADNLSKLFGTYQVGGCWCGPSYFTGSDGVGRVVTSGGTNVGIWKIKGSTAPTLEQTFQSSVNVDDGQDPGFFTSVSSNGTNADSEIIWAVSRPTDSNPADVKLYAFDNHARRLFSASAGRWPNTSGNANIVPTVANGHVYVASNKMLAIFGLSQSGPAAEPPIAASEPYRPALAPGMHEVYGMIRGVNGSLITIQTRGGRSLTIDAAAAMRTFDYAAPKVGRALLARGMYEPSGVFRAQNILHAKPNPAIWMADR